MDDYDRVARAMAESKTAGLERELREAHEAVIAAYRSGIASLPGDSLAARQMAMREMSEALSTRITSYRERWGRDPQ